MSTIVLIILVVLVMSALGIFFLTHISKQKEATGSYADYAKCSQLCANAKQIGSSIYGKEIPYCDNNCDDIYKCCVDGNYIKCDPGGATRFATC